MNKTYKIQLSHNKEAQNIKTNIKDGTIEVEVELKEKWEPRDGDICYIENNYHHVFIFKEVICNSIYSHIDLRLDTDTLYYMKDDIVCSALNIKIFRPATNTEKQLLFDALAKKGKMWNDQKKAVVDLPRWRAGKGEPYCFVDPFWEVSSDIDDRTSPHDSLYRGGNYFKTEEAAWKTIEQIREIFKNSKAE